MKGGKRMRVTDSEIRESLAGLCELWKIYDCASSEFQNALTNANDLLSNIFITFNDIEGHNYVTRQITVEITEITILARDFDFLVLNFFSPKNQSHEVIALEAIDFNSIQIKEGVMCNGADRSRNI